MGAIFMKLLAVKKIFAVPYYRPAVPFETKKKCSRSFFFFIHN